MGLPHCHIIQGCICLLKPNFEMENELLGLPKGWDSYGSDGALLAAREKALEEKIENTSSDDDNMERKRRWKGRENSRGRRGSVKTSLLEQDSSMPKQSQSD